MKTRIIFILLLLTILLNGCLFTEDTTGSVVKGDSVCNAPYFEYKAGECCLDKNSNSICDTDDSATEATTSTEEATTTKTETTTTTTKAETKEEVEITVDDSCSDTSYFECLASYLTTNEIFFKLKTRKDGYTHLKKISALGCEKTFADKDKANRGYTIRSNVLISLPCTKLTAGDEVKDSEYILEYIFYPMTGIDSDTGEWEGKARFLQRSTGTISGTVRNNPKKIL